MYSWDVIEATQRIAQVGAICVTAAANFMECVAMKRMFKVLSTMIRCIPIARALGLAMRRGSMRMRDRKIIKTFINVSMGN